ncbi:MAG: DUF202 domain-containing protein [Cyanobacteria bacterium P01_H01_bin.15]
MESKNFPGLKGPTNELAKERNRAAAERTMTAWLQNCLTLIGVGLCVDDLSRINRPEIRLNQVITYLPQLFSLILIGVGIGLLILAIAQHRLEVRSLENHDYVFMSIDQLNRMVVLAIVLFGVISGLTICWVR